MDVGLTWTDCEEAGDYVVPNVLSPRDLVSRPDNMDETVLHMYRYEYVCDEEFYCLPSQLFWARPCLSKH